MSSTTETILPPPPSFVGPRHDTKKNVNLDEIRALMRKHGDELVLDPVRDDEDMPPPSTQRCPVSSAG